MLSTLALLALYLHLLALGSTKDFKRSDFHHELVPFFFIIFGLNFGFLFFGVLDFLGAFWEPSSAS